MKNKLINLALLAAVILIIAVINDYLHYLYLIPAGLFLLAHRIISVKVYKNNRNNTKLRLL
jgi:hypothetical protein